MKSKTELLEQFVEKVDVVINKIPHKYYNSGLRDLYLLQLETMALLDDEKQRLREESRSASQSYRASFRERWAALGCKTGGLCE